MKILFVAPRMPFPPLKGDRVRPYNFVKELSGRHSIDLCTFCEGEEDMSGISEMRKYCRNVETVQLSRFSSYINTARGLINFRPLQVNYYYSGEMAKKIRAMSTSNNYDVVHFVLNRMTPYRRFCNGEKVVLDHIDALSLNMIRRAKNEHSILKKAVFNYEAFNLSGYEKRIRGTYDASIVSSKIDKDALGDDTIEVIPNGVDTGYFRPVSRDKDIDFIFTGNMNYFPNVNAALYFAEEILPKILRTRPDASFYIVGIDPSKEVRALHDGKNIIVTGFVDDIREYMNRSRVFVAPLRSGSGIQNKILEAFACGVPVVSSTCGNAGISAKDGEHLLIADDPMRFVSALIELLDNKEKRDSLSEKARCLAEKEFSWSKSTRLLEGVYNRVIAG